MLTLYHAPGTCAPASHLALQCCGAVNRFPRVEDHLKRTGAQPHVQKVLAAHQAG